MHGGSPAFPADGDARAEREAIHLYAIIRGAKYAMHIVMGDRDSETVKFEIPFGVGVNVLVLDVVQLGEMSFDVVEFDPEAMPYRESEADRRSKWCRTRSTVRAGIAGRVSRLLPNAFDKA